MRLGSLIGGGGSGQIPLFRQTLPESQRCERVDALDRALSARIDPLHTDSIRRVIAALGRRPTRGVLIDASTYREAGALGYVVDCCRRATRQQPRLIEWLQRRGTRVATEE